MTEIQKIHNLHMNISYNSNHDIHMYIENIIKLSKSFIFNRHFVISINRFNQYDMSIQILKNNIISKDEFMDKLLTSIKNPYILEFLNKSINLSICKPYNTNEIRMNIKLCYDHNKTMLDCPINKNIDNMILDLINEYTEFVKSVYIMKLNNISFKICKICLWVYEKYELLKNIYNNDNENTNIMFTSLIIFLGMIEWFHLLLIKIMIDKMQNENCKNNNTCLIIHGEESLIEIEYMSLYSSKEIRDFYSNEYCSHSTVYLIDNNNYFSLGQPRTFEENIDIMSKCRYVIGLEGGWTHVSHSMRVPYIICANQRPLNEIKKFHSKHPNLQIIDTQNMRDFLVL